MRAHVVPVVVFVVLAVTSCGGASFDRVAAQKRIDVELSKRSSPTPDARTCVGEKVLSYTVADVKALDKALAAGTDTDPTVTKVNDDLSECRRPELTKVILDQIDTGGGPSLSDSNKACLGSRLQTRPARELEALKVETKLDEPNTELGKGFELELFDCSRDTIAALLAGDFEDGLSDESGIELSPAERACITDYVTSLKATDLRDAMKDDNESPATPAGQELVKKVLSCASPSIVTAITDQVDAEYNLDDTDRACVTKVLSSMSPNQLLELSKAGNGGKAGDTSELSASLTKCFRGVYAASILESIAKNSTISPGYRACVTAAIRKFTDAEFGKLLASPTSAETKALLSKVDVTCPNLTV
jgi:hypothetical protein